MEKLVLIDGNSLINRAFYAMPVLLTKDGVPTNAVYGFINMFIKMLETVKPTYVAVAFDLKAPTFRQKMYSEYKGTRKPMPDDLRPQIPLLKEVLSIMGITCIEKEGIEADDIIGTIAKHTDIQTIIYTGDKDSFQLVDEQTTVYFTKRGITDIDIYNAENFTEKTELEPSQIIDLKALMGDSSDNIPGVAGIGEKTAKTLLKTYRNVDGVYQNIEEQKGKLKEKLIEGKDSCYLSKTLATINTDCKIDTSVEKMTITFPFGEKVKEKFNQLEFKTLVKREDIFEKSNSNVTLVENKQARQMDVKIEKCFDVDFIKNLSTGTIAVSLQDDLLSIFDEQLSTVFDLKIRASMLEDGVSLSQALSSFKQLLNTDRKIIVFNKKQLRHYFKDTIGELVNANFEDVSLMKYVADYSGKDEKLEDCLIEYNLDNLAKGYGVYCLYQTLKEKLIEEDAERLYLEIELPLSDVLFDMEVNGFKIDYEKLYQMGVAFKKRLTVLEERIKELTGEKDFNVNSPKQLGEVLFEKLKIGKSKKNKNGYSTSAEILEGLVDAHPSVALILEYRQLQKLYSTYIEGFKPLIDKSTGLIHTSFNQTVTATGRLSSKEPNLQNIPVRDSEGKELRKFFVPSNIDGVIISADYSQIELRLLAAFSGCEGLIKAFRDGEDVHSITASKVFNVPLGEVNDRMRRSAKAVNFGIIYGISEYGLAKNIGVSNAQAREYINSYFNQYPEVKTYMDNNVAFAKKNGYVATLFNRKRYIRELMSANYNVRQFGERVAMNMPLQGSSADIIKLAMINVDKRLKEEKLKTKLILQVHDELILDAVKEEEQIAKRILKEEMENAVNLSVKLTVEVGSGNTWFDAK